jgi:hypothetical protein
MHCKFTPTLILLTLLAIATTACVAQTWDATKDFGPLNPNGAWSCGYGITGLSFTLDPFYDPDCAPVSGVVCWTADTESDIPVVGFNTTGGWLNWLTIVDPPDVLAVQPGPNEGLQDTIVQWTAPVAGTYTISGFFEILDTSPTGIMGFVFDDHTLLYRRELLGPPAQHPDQVGGREDFYFAKLFLNAGDVLSFGVNSDGDNRYDSTGFNATITRTFGPCAGSCCSK